MQVIENTTVVAPAPIAIPEGVGRSNQMILHCGGAIATREEVAAVKTPANTQTWYPLRHIDVVTTVERALGANGLEVTAPPTYALSHEGQRFFGVYTVAMRGNEEDKPYSWSVAVRNADDMAFSAGLAAGSRVFVCDNLAFSASIAFSRKHTRFAQRDLPQLAARAVGKLGAEFSTLDKRVEAYTATTLRDSDVHDIAIRCMDSGVVPASQLPLVLNEWREPTHEEFAPRNAWSLFNGFTEVFKARVNDPTALIKRSEALHGIMDMQCGFATNN